MTRPDQPLGARPPLNDLQRLRQPLGWPLSQPALGQFTPALLPKDLDSSSVPSHSSTPCLGQSIQARLQDHPLLQPLFLPPSQSSAPSRFQLPEAFTRFATLIPASEVRGDRPPTPSAQQDTHQDNPIQAKATQESLALERSSQEAIAQEVPAQEKVPERNMPQGSTIQDEIIQRSTTLEETTLEETTQEGAIQENPAKESTSQLNRREQSASVEDSTADGVEADAPTDPGTSPDISRLSDPGVPSADTIQAESDSGSNEVEQGRSPHRSFTESSPGDLANLPLASLSSTPEPLPLFDAEPSSDVPDADVERSPQPRADQDTAAASVSELEPEAEPEPEPELTNFADSTSLFSSSPLPDETPAIASFAADSPVYPDPEDTPSVPSVNLQPDSIPPSRPDGEALSSTTLTLSDRYLSLLPDQQTPSLLESFTALPSPVSTDETPDRGRSSQALPDFTIAPLVAPLSEVAGEQDDSESGFPALKGVPPNVNLTAGTEPPSGIESRDLSVEVFSEPSGIPRQTAPHLPPFLSPVLDENSTGDASIDIAPKGGEGRSPQDQPSLQDASASDRRAIAATGEVQLRQSEPAVDTVISPLPTVSDQGQQDQIYQQNQIYQQDQPVELLESNSPDIAPIIQAKFTPLMPSLRHPLGQWQQLQEGQVLADANSELDASPADEPFEASTFNVHTSHAALVASDSAVTQNSTAASSSIVSPSSGGPTAKQPTAKQPPEAQPTEVGVSEGELGSTAADTVPIASPQNWASIEDLLVNSAPSLQPSLQEDWEQQFSLLSPTTRRSAEAPPTEAPLDGPESAMMSAKLTAQPIPDRFQPGNAADAASSAVTLANPLDALSGAEQALAELDDETLEQLARYLYCHFRDRLVLAQERHGLPADYPSAWLAVAPRNSLAGRSPSRQQTGPPRASPEDGEVPIPREVAELIETVCGSLASRLRYDSERHGY